ncbi:hypothetical protein CTAYLR_007332 [Chrysophaeum taylorii]|uniref:AB hydrolase-1 domain-containing protein n=1 Tax=Chrysophaeum taylorii TaxID=2483200 RepID=A0AAD7XKP9_9STRA|nr:hypothetical protein CTAYLR_007332 [Chrysophaeum taylorii]
MDVLYCRRDRVHAEPKAARSPAVFLHGFPDSSDIFEKYVVDTAAAWLNGREIFTIDFPNRRTNPDRVPPLSLLVAGELWHGGSLQREVDALLDATVAESPTGKLLLVAHDWGATCAWSWIRRRPSAPVEAMVSLSVGSSFRYDVLEHGVGALQWAYSAVFSLGYYLPHRWIGRLIGNLAKHAAGYRADDLDEVYRDAWHYWYGPFELLLLPLKLVGFRYVPPFVGFPFPVLYIRAESDRIATTAAFESHLRERPDCRVLVLGTGFSHWFPEQHPDLVLAQIRDFPPLRPEPAL